MSYERRFEGDRLEQGVAALLVFGCTCGSAWWHAYGELHDPSPALKYWLLLHSAHAGFAGLDPQAPRARA